MPASRLFTARSADRSLYEAIRVARSCGSVVARRGLAMPVNPASSVDHMLGTAVPAAPAAAPEQSRNDSSEDSGVFKSMLQKGVSSADMAGQRANIERLRGAATGSSRRSTAVPGTNKLLAQSLDDAEILWRDESAFLPPTAKKQTPADPELPHRVETGRPEGNAMERYAVAAARALVKQRSGSLQMATLHDLSKAMEGCANTQLSIELPYEPMPKVERKVQLTTATSVEADISKSADDGVLLLCYVDHIGSGKERVSMCSGFAVQGGETLAKTEGKGRGALVVSCDHTLESATEGMRDTGDRQGLALAVTRLGHIYPVRSLLSRLPDADLALFQLDETPVQVDAVTSTLHTVGSGSLRTLPVSPYPAVVHTELSVSSFGGWLPAPQQGQGELSTFPQLTDHDVIRNRWAPATLVGYKDPIGRVAETGTYDELAQLSFKLKGDVPETPEGLRPSNLMRSMTYFPLPGSSGGPVVDAESGSVVGIVRGHRTSQMHGSRGDAVPAEKVFEFFALPGLGKRR